MVCRAVRKTGRGTRRRGPPVCLDGYPACLPLRSYSFSLDIGMRPVFNGCSVQPGEAPDGEVNVHVGNPSLWHPWLKHGERKVKQCLVMTWGFPPPGPNSTLG